MKKLNAKQKQEIKELKNLHEKGVLSEDEFRKAKEKILK